MPHQHSPRAQLLLVMSQVMLCPMLECQTDPIPSSCILSQGIQYFALVCFLVGGTHSCTYGFPHMCTPAACCLRFTQLCQLQPGWFEGWGGLGSSDQGDRSEDLSLCGWGVRSERALDAGASGKFVSVQAVPCHVSLPHIIHMLWSVYFEFSLGRL